jgi:hypothetical protein
MFTLSQRELFTDGFGSGFWFWGERKRECFGKRLHVDVEQVSFEQYEDYDGADDEFWDKI